MSDDKEFDPFAIIDAQETKPKSKKLSEADIDSVGAKHGFQTGKASKEKPKPVKKTKPKPEKPKIEIRTLRKKLATPKVPFSVKITPDVANGFYDYAREHGVNMGEVMRRAFEALDKSKS